MYKVSAKSTVFTVRLSIQSSELQTAVWQPGSQPGRCAHELPPQAFLPRLALSIGSARVNVRGFEMILLTLCQKNLL